MPLLHRGHPAEPSLCACVTHRAIATNTSDESMISFALLSGPGALLFEQPGCKGAGTRTGTQRFSK